MPDAQPISIAMSVSVSTGADEPAAPVDVTVVELADGRLGFVAQSDGWPGDGVAVVLTAGERRVDGRTTLVRSGSAYEEVRGRLRADAGAVERWRLRRDRPVVLVLPEL